jgi:cardiolipin synthase
VVDGETAFIGGYNIGELYRVQWRDTHVRVKGPHAARLGQDFIDFWNRHTTTSERILWNLRRGVQPRLQHSTNDARRLMFPIRDMYVDAIGRAERRVWITTAYFIPDTVLRNALIDAAKRGVDVKVFHQPARAWRPHLWLPRCDESRENNDGRWRMVNGWHRESRSAEPDRELRD